MCIIANSIWNYLKNAIWILKNLNLFMKDQQNNKNNQKDLILWFMEDISINIDEI